MYNTYAGNVTLSYFIRISGMNISNRKTKRKDRGFSALSEISVNS